jgi:hypothetical protein
MSWWILNKHFESIIFCLLAYVSVSLFLLSFYYVLHLRKLVSQMRVLYALFAPSSDRLMNTIWQPDPVLFTPLVYFCIGSRRGSLNVQFPFFHPHPSHFSLSFYISSSSFSFFDSTTLRKLSIIYRVSLYWWIVYTWLLRSNGKSDRCNSIRKLFLLLHLSSILLIFLLLLLFHYTFDKFHSEKCNIFHVQGTVYICLYNWSLKCDSSSSSSSPSSFSPPPPPILLFIAVRLSFKSHVRAAWEFKIRVRPTSKQTNKIWGIKSSPAISRVSSKQAPMFLHLTSGNNIVANSQSIFHKI